MNDLKKKRMQAVMKYTWPFYILTGIVIAIFFNFLFGITHRLPAYKTFTLFISGEVTDYNKLESDLLNRYQEKELKTVSFISCWPTDNNYNTKLTVTGYNGADVLIIPFSKLDKLVVSAFALELSDSLISSHYQGYTLFKQDDINYGVKIDREKIKNYMNLPEEDCYMLLNGKSENTGEYSPSHTKEHDIALTVVQEWGI